MIRKLWYAFRSSITGLFVRKSYADDHPNTTEDERRARRRKTYDKLVHPEDE